MFNDDAIASSFFLRKVLQSTKYERPNICSGLHSPFSHETCPLFCSFLLLLPRRAEIEFSPSSQLQTSASINLGNRFQALAEASDGLFIQEARYDYPPLGQHFLQSCKRLVSLIPTEMASNTTNALQFEKQLDTAQFFNFCSRKPLVPFFLIMKR